MKYLSKLMQDQGWIILLLALVLTMLGMFMLNKLNSQKVTVTRVNRVIIAAHINTYKKETGVNPKSIKALYVYMKEKEEVSQDVTIPIEMITGNNTETAQVNGGGGWYYNPETGALKVNLLKPLKDYFFIYFDSNKDEIPANWTNLE